MTDSSLGTRPANLVDRLNLRQAADFYAALVAASLPWSTSATSILLVVWLVMLLPTLDGAAIRREVMTAAGGTPLLLVALMGVGMLWADVSFGERLWGIEGYLKLLCIPLLFLQFRRSPNGAWIIAGFFAAALVLLAVSWAEVLAPGWPWHGKWVGIPVKDYITQSGVFAICAFAALGHAAAAWRDGRRGLALVLVGLCATFLANIMFVETGRTTLVSLAVLTPLFGLRQFGWKGMVAAGGVAVVLAGVFWVSSPYLRSRISRIGLEVELYRSDNEATSTGARLDFWRNSLESIGRAPIFGHGTGSVPEQLRSHISPETGLASIGTVNPHNEIFLVAIQLGLIGTMAIVAMWISHLLLFRGEDQLAWFGLVAVVENVVSSLANSHISDFTQGWIYVFAVGSLGGMVLRRREKASPPPR